MAGYGCSGDYIPGWARKETPIFISEDASFSLHAMDNEIGVLASTPAPEDIGFVKGEAAFLFGTSQEELYFRANCSTFIRIGIDEDKAGLRERIFNSHTAVFWTCKGMETETEHGIPVFHDALAMLPHRATDTDDEADNGLEPEYEEEAEEEEDLHDYDPLDDEDYDEQPEASPIYMEEQGDYEIQIAIDVEIASRRGILYARHIPDDSDAPRFDLAFLKGRCIIMVYAGFPGQWLADEDPVCDEPPLWFSETSHHVSPVYQALRYKDILAKGNPGVEALAIVIASQGCFIINDGDRKIRRCWRKQCDVTVARTIRLEGSRLSSLHAFLSLLPAVEGEPEPPDAELMAGLAKAMIEGEA